jgi:hypothetical protein
VPSSPAPTKYPVTTDHSSDDGQAQAAGSRRFTPSASPEGSSLHQPAGSLLKGATDDQGNLKNAALLLGIKLDLEAEIHLTARIRGDITIGLY